MELYASVQSSPYIENIVSTSKNYWHEVLSFS